MSEQADEGVNELPHARKYERAREGAGTTPVNVDRYHMLKAPENSLNKPVDSQASSNSLQIRTLRSTVELDLVRSKLSRRFEGNVNSSEINLQPKLSVMNIGPDKSSEPDANVAESAPCASLGPSGRGLCGG